MKRGFTLVEILVATAIFILIMSTIYSVFYTTVRSREAGIKAGELYTEGVEFLKGISQELMCAYLDNAWKKENSKTIFLSDRDSFNGRPMDKLTFTHLCHRTVEGGGRQSDHEEVTYYWQLDAETEKVKLMKRVDTTMDSEPDKGGAVFEVLVGVKEFRLIFYDGTGWVEGWGTERTTLPYAVHIFLALDDGQGGEVPFETTIPLLNRKSETQSVKVVQ